MRKRAGTTGTAGEHFGRLGNKLDKNSRCFVAFYSLSEITYFSLLIWGTNFNPQFLPGNKKGTFLTSATLVLR